MTTRELVDIFLKMFGAHFVERSVVSTLEQAPKALDPVGVSLAFHKLQGAVLDRPVVEVCTESIVTLVVVCVNCGANGNPILDESLQALLGNYKGFYPKLSHLLGKIVS